MAVGGAGPGGASPPGCMLTNFKTIRQSIKRLHELEELRDSGALERRNKKEAQMLRREMDKLMRSLGGIKDMALTMLGWIPLFGWIVFAPGYRAKGLAAIAGLWALVPTWLALSRLYLQDGDGRELVIFVLLLAWAADIGAYFAGRHFGRLRLAPVVSPNKTWEGVLGGLIAGILVAVAALTWFDLPPLAFLSLCVAAILASVVGDLLESMFKRQSGLKDSGSLLPGHGGVLDRIDSLTSSVPLLALGLGWLGLVA